MAALTWRDVAAPSFAGVNESYRTAGAQMQQALSGLADGLKQFQAQRQAGIDAGILGRALQIQDPNQMREALTSGSLLQGVDLSKVNPKILAQLDERTGALLRNAATEQGIASSKLGDKRTQQTIDQSDYAHNRTIQENTNEDAARGQLAQLLGLTGPLANLSTKDQQNVASTQSTLATQRLGRAATALGMDQTRQNMSQSATNFNNSQTDRNEQREALTTADDITRQSASVEDARANLDDMADQSPVVRARVNALLTNTFGNLYAPIDGAATGGKAGAGSGAPSDETATPSAQAAEALALNARRVAQNSSPGVVADIERTIGDTRSVGEVAQEIAKLIPEADIGKITGRLAKAKSDNPDLSAAEVGAAMTRSLRDAGFFTPGTTSLGDGTGYDDGAFTANLKDLRSGKADYQSAGNRQVRAVGTAIKNADAALTKAKQELLQVQRRAQTQLGVDTSRYQERVDRAQQKLNDAIKKQTGNPDFMPKVPEVIPVPVPRRAVNPFPLG